ncbi:type I-E CRISPR-associated endonuclease Cas1e [Streptomyces sp. NPDC101206]|uniref:type I-E CRISPR-associated endonuclease Cas1e n=1 Tax=Streptomyces sp. NPDC101206 TaxID=3366128 RepID=UPI0037FB9121
MTTQPTPARQPADARRRLAKPTVAMLPRIADSLSFLYLDVVRIHQDDTGVRAEVSSDRGNESVYLPTAALSCVLLGPGTSITARALTTLARHGTTVLIAGSGGVRCYAAALPDSLSTTWLERQTRAWCDDDRRLAIATAMYEKRFGKDSVPKGATSLAQLRGMEGQRVKAHYRLLAQQHRIGRFRRTYDPAAWDSQDPVNLALSAANTCLYGIVHAAILALGCSPALGFIHSGNQQAFVYDIADLYKAQLTIPLAFSLHASSNPEAAARRSFRDGLRLFSLLPRIVADLQDLLDPGTKHAVPDVEEELVDLWDPVTGPVRGGTNHASSPATPAGEFTWPQ